MSGGPRGLVTGDRFVEYLHRFRENFPPNAELAAEHGLSTENGHIQPMTTTTTSDSDAQTYDEAYLEAAAYAHPDAVAWTYLTNDTQAALSSNVGRRAFMIGVGATAATGLAGSAAAQTGGNQLNFEYDLVHDPFVTADVTVETHEPEFSQFDYIADDDSVQSLAGATLAEREDEETPHNPVRVRADLIDIDDYRRFPADLTTTNADDEEVDASALDSAFWTTDVSGSSGSMSVTEDEDALNVTTTGQTTGDVATASFTDFTIGDGEQRRVLQLVANVNQLAADAVVTVSVVDAASNSVSAVIDSSADAAAASTIATAQGSGIIYQQQLGELTGGESLDTIEAVHIEVSDADADVTFHGFNLESASRWQFGQREQTDADNELITETVYEQTGWFGITDLSTLYSTDRFAKAVLEKVEYDAEFRASELPSGYVQYTFEDSGRSDFDRRMRYVYNFQFPSAYSLDIQLGSWYDEVVFKYPADRYMAVEAATGLTEQVGLDSTDDVEWTSRTSSYVGAGEGENVSLSSTPTVDGVMAVKGDVLYRSKEEQEATAVGGMGPTGREGGFLSQLFGPLGAVLSAIGLAGIANYFRGA